MAAQVAELTASADAADAAAAAGEADARKAIEQADAARRLHARAASQQRSELERRVANLRLRTGYEPPRRAPTAPAAGTAGGA
eukprot:3642541-Prymnesium_polylepis.1